MVTRVYGRAGQFDIEFVKSSEGLWTTTIPLSDSYELVVDLYAEDDAGNVSYYATYIVLFDSKNLSIKLIPSPYRVILLDQEYGARLMSDIYREEHI